LRKRTTIRDGQKFQDVLNAPELKKNLVCISVMEYKGYKVTFNDGKVHIWKNNVKDAFILGFSVDSLYQVDGSLLGVMSYDISLQSELWHQRFPPFIIKLYSV